MDFKTKHLQKQKNREAGQEVLSERTELRNLTQEIRKPLLLDKTYTKVHVRTQIGLKSTFQTQAGEMSHVG